MALLAGHIVVLVLLRCHNLHKWYQHSCVECVMNGRNIQGKVIGDPIVYCPECGERALESQMLEPGEAEQDDGWKEL